MPVGIYESGRKFITTEPIGKDGEQSEQKVWDKVREAFASRECIGYWRYPIFSKTGETRKEPDILIADKKLGFVVIEVKGVTIDQIVAINGHQWQFQNFYINYGNPYDQAENQLNALLKYCDHEPLICKQVIGRAIVALPLITQEEWRKKGFDRLPCCPPIIFKDQLGSATLLRRIEQTTHVAPGKELDDEQWELLLAVIGGTQVLYPSARDVAPVEKTGKTRSSVVATSQNTLYKLDLQQEHIAKEIPPGLQRIRGIAGSGKTVLLCQKAAHMHLKHPDWDIALVFFTRSLYDKIESLIDKWIRHFSNGAMRYDFQTKRKLKILHAWGAWNQPGLYKTICNANGYPHLTAQDTSYKKPNEALADVCGQLLHRLEEDKNFIEPIFDAILIDEGQDLLVDKEELKYKDKQPVYWMAWQALKPIDSDISDIRRLIWAYDEAQSLDNLKIPEFKEVFGQELAKVLTKGPTYKGDIKKSEIMKRCYRTPSSIITAAHAIGMGLLRPQGMLSGVTNTRDWEDLGYEVKGDFRKNNEEITLHRPPKNSPNPVPALWGEPVLNVGIYRSRQEELHALAQHIKHNLEYDRLKPSRDILVIILGDFEAIQLETHVAGFLMEQGINIFVPAAPAVNTLNFHWQRSRPNIFWEEGAVTVSRIQRAKGNEAHMVYVIGFDNVARDERNINLRNQLFVALTRSRGWVRLSGIGSYGMYEEMQRVIASGDTFTFINKPPRRDIGEEENKEVFLATNYSKIGV
ncbi:ATP-binding domain-containing protein [Microcoleus sp. FACHB-53]|nr:ATP-binding domain-containing protein [Microcoleus sp. FACHB-53]